MEATFHSSKELIENTIQDETHCHLVYGFEFLLSAKSFLSLLNQRKIKMTVIFVVPNTQCFSMTRDDIWWVGMSTKAHKLKLIQTFGCGTSKYLIYCEAQGKGRAKGRPWKVTQRSFIDGGWWMVDILSLMLYTKFGCHPPPPSHRKSLNLQD